MRDENVVHRVVRSIYTGKNNLGGYGNKMMTMHHDIIGKPPTGMVVDHIDKNPLNNMRSNLRFTTHTGNMRNSKSYRGGITFNRDSLRVSVNVPTKELGERIMAYAKELIASYEDNRNS